EEGGDDAHEDGHTRFEFHGGDENEAGAEIAEGDAREDSVEAHGVPVHVREEDEDVLQEEDFQTAKNYMAGERLAAVAFCGAGVERKDDGGTDQEEESWEDEVGEGPAIPRGVVERREDVVPIAGIVDQDHEGDGDAAEEVDGEDARWSGNGVLGLLGCGGWKDGGHCDHHLTSRDFALVDGTVARCAVSKQHTHSSAGC